MKCLYKSFKAFNGKLFAIMNGQRILIAECSPRIEVWKHTNELPILGKGSGIKAYKISIVFCEDDNSELKKYVDMDKLMGISSFELVTDVLKENGEEMVHMQLKNMTQTDIELYGDWTFNLDVVETNEILQKLK
jgi:hypothetical protein